MSLHHLYPICSTAARPQSLAAASEALHLVLSRVERASFEDDQSSVKQDLAQLREIVQHVIAVSLLSAADRVLMERALARFEEVLGDEHEGYLALWRRLTNKPHPLDLEPHRPDT